MSYRQYAKRPASRIAVCLLGIFLALACNRSQTPPPDDAKDSGKSPPAAEKPIDYWVAEARAEGGPKDLQATVKALTAAAEHAETEVRLAAIDALGVLGSKAAPAAGVLVQRLTDHSAWVRVSAMETLAAVGPGAVPALADAVENGKTPPLRVRSTIVLGSMGSDAKAAVSLLEKIAADESLPWRSWAASSLSKIDPEKFPPTVAAPAAGKTAVLPKMGKPLAPASKDWPQFRGPGRAGLCAETGLAKTWPAGGPKLLWQAKGPGRGYSMVSIAGERIFASGDRGAKGADARQYVVAMSLADGKELWATEIGPGSKDGAYSTPTVDGELLYVIGAEGDLVCLEASGGKERWKKSLPGDFGGKTMSRWKFSESPLVDGPRLICTPGSKDAGIVALDKLTGKTIWKSALPEFGKRGKDGAGYASAIVAEICGRRQYVQVTGRGVVGVEAESGKFLWGYDRVANKIANIPSAVVRGDYVFATSGYGTGAALLKISRDGDAFSAEEIYFLGPKRFENHHGGVVLVGDHIYAGHGTSKGSPVCIELATGKIAWKAKQPQRGSASVLYVDGHILYRWDRGMVALVEATPEEFRVKARFKPILGMGPAWTHPVVHNRRLYLRHGDLLLCYDLGA